MENKNIAVEVNLSSHDLRSHVQYFVLSFEILLCASEGDEQIEATAEVREGFNEDAETFARANMDTLQLDPEPDDVDVKTAITSKIEELLKAEGYETSD